MQMIAVLSGLLLASALTAQWHVSPAGNDAGAGSPSDPFRTVNHAVGVASSGQTIFLQAGSYGDEQGVVVVAGKDLVLQGAGSEASVLHPHSTRTVVLPPMQIGGGAAVAHRVAVRVTGGAVVHLRDLGIDGESIVPPSGHLVGLYIDGAANVVCERCTIRRCRAPGSGVGATHAVGLLGDVAVDPTTLLARRCTLEGFGDGGVFGRLRAELDLIECTLIGAGGAASGDQFGVSVGEDATGRVRSCRIVACGGVGGTAIRLVQHSTPCVLDGNRIARCAIGIDVRHTPAAIVPGEVRNNTVTAVDTTLRIAGVSGLFVTGNTLAPVSRFDPLPYRDDSVAGNAWIGNRYPVAATTGAVAIPGGSNVDASPRAGAGQFRDLERVACVGAPVAVVAADFDGDGRDDFATLDLVGASAGLSIGLWRPGGHQVTAVPIVSGSLRPVALVAGEFDGMPGTDLVALTAPSPPSTDGAAFWVFGNDGSGQFGLLHRQSLTTFVDPTAVVAVGLNGDPRDDLVVVDRGAPPLSPGSGAVYVNAFGGVSWSASALPGTFADALTAVAAGDLDGDGHEDLVVVEAGPGGGLLHRWQGDGLAGLTLVSGAGEATADWPSGVVVDDVDLDDDLDVLVLATEDPLPVVRGSLQRFTNVGGVLVAEPKLATDAGPTRAIVADFGADAFLDPDGPDALVLNVAAADLSLFGSLDERAGFVDGGLVTLAHAPVDVADTDLDTDSYRDVVLAEPARGGVALLHGAPLARVHTFGEGCPGTAGRVPRLVVDGSPALPIQPNGSLRFEVQDGFPMSIAACAVGFEPAPVLAPCGFFVQAPVALLFGAFLDGDGRGVIPLGLPATPSSLGFRICAQAGVYDFAATTSFLPDFSLTAAICLRVGV